MGPYERSEPRHRKWQEKMNTATIWKAFVQSSVMLALGSFVAGAVSPHPVPAPLKEDVTIDLNGRKATVRKLDTLPYVEGEYTRRFRFDSFDNPKLTELRQRYKLDEVIAPGRDEFDQQVLLLDWTHRQFKKFGRPSASPKGALETLGAIEEGHTFSALTTLRCSCPPPPASDGWIVNWRCDGIRAWP